MGTIKSINLNGVTQRSRRQVNRASSVSVEEVSDPVKLTEIIRQLSVRVSELEAASSPDSVEFEFNTTGTVGAGEELELNHGFGCPVRWYVTYWRVDSPGHEAPSIMEHTTEPSDSNVLRLEIHSAGRIVIRVEKSQFGLT